MRLQVRYCMNCGGPAVTRIFVIHRAEETDVSGPFSVRGVAPACFYGCEVKR
jgi:hypothetical protein